MHTDDDDDENEDVDCDADDCDDEDDDVRDDSEGDVHVIVDGEDVQKAGPWVALLPWM